jgi:hypothetical protein
MTITFKQHLQEIGYDPNEYLKIARKAGKINGYDPSKIDFADDGIHKLQIMSPESKTIKFGRNMYGDFLIWSFLEKHGVVKKGYANMKRNVFNASHGKMQELLEQRKGSKQPYSANALALKILW